MANASMDLSEDILGSFNHSGRDMTIRPLIVEHPAEMAPFDHEYAHLAAFVRADPNFPVVEILTAPLEFLKKVHNNGHFV